MLLYTRSVTFSKNANNSHSLSFYKDKIIRDNTVTEGRDNMKPVSLQDTVAQ